MEVLQSTKGRPQIAFNGFLYNKKGQSPNESKFYWICTRKHRECKGSLITTSELGGPEEGKQHNHLPDMLFTNMVTQGWQEHSSPPLKNIEKITLFSL